MKTTQAIRKLMKKYNIIGSVKSTPKLNWTHVITVEAGNGADFQKFVNESIFEDARYFPQEGTFGVFVTERSIEEIEA